MGAWVLVTAASGLGLTAVEEARKAYLAEELEIARTHEPYLVLQPEIPSLDLKVDGIVLRRFTVTRAEFGQPRLRRGHEVAWPATTFTLVSELPEPDRPKIRIPEPGEQAHEHGEKQLEVPMTYRLKFSPNLMLVVRGEPKKMDLASRVRRLGFRLREGWEGFAAWLRGRPAHANVRLHLPPESARRLFQALVPEIRLLVAAPPAPGVLARAPARVHADAPATAAAPPESLPAPSGAGLAGAPTSAPASASAATDSALAATPDSALAATIDSALASIDSALAASIDSALAASTDSALTTSPDSASTGVPDTASARPRDPD